MPNSRLVTSQNPVKSRTGEEKIGAIGRPAGRSRPRIHPDAGGHEPRYCARRADDASRRTPVEGKKGRRSGHAANGEEQQEERRPVTARDDRPERQQPHAIDAQMDEIGVQEHMADERHREAEKATAGKARAVARRDEGELRQDLVRPAEPAPRFAPRARAPAPRSATGRTPAHAGTVRAAAGIAERPWGFRSVGAARREHRLSHNRTLANIHDGPPRSDCRARHGYS